MKAFSILAPIFILSLMACTSSQHHDPPIGLNETTFLEIKSHGDEALQILGRDGGQVLVTQVARADHRPYLHPISAPDGQGALTEYSPGHHKHQTGLYWGFTRMNDRDYFHHPEGSHWSKVSATILDQEGLKVSWQTVYHLLDVHAAPILEERQTWTVTASNGRLVLDLNWQGKALADITIGEYDYGGLFLRMPWHEGIKGRAVNAARQENAEAEGQRANWLSVGMQVEGREDLAHITIFDHPQNQGFPQPWRVDHQLGVGPVRARMGDWSIAQDSTETINHRLICHTGDFDDTEVLEWWQEYLGRNDFYTDAVLWGLAQEEGRNAKFLRAEEAAAEMSVHPGYEVNAWASEPMITQPMAFCWDDQGRLWVAENRDYESRGHGFANSGDSRILILEDTDRDGQADSRKVFLEDIPFPSAIAVGFDGLFLGAPPNLLFVPDRDRDDRADTDDIEVLLTGWGIRDRHETINSFLWGPDGWLYGLEGFATPSKIRKPKDGGKIYRHGEAFPDDLLEAEGIPIDGGVWRYHPTKDQFEVVAHGFSNPWGIDYDKNGQLFITACVIPHMFHIIPGGIYQRQGGKHINPYVYDDIKTIVDHRHRSAHGGARIYLSDAFPEDQHGKLFMANIHEHAVLSDILVPKASGFVASHGDDFVQANNAQWIGFSIELGPAGNLYVLDWHDGDICGKEVLDKETGRIFRIAPKESEATIWPNRFVDLSTLSDLELAQLQTSPSSWHARRARLILQHRASKGPIGDDASQSLVDQLHDKNSTYRVRALWTLHITQFIDDDYLRDLLNDEDEYIRGWAIQFLLEDQEIENSILNSLVTMAVREQSAVVRKYLAAGLQKLPATQRYDLAHSLAGHPEDNSDHNIPKLVWYGVEPLVSLDLAASLRLASSSRLDLVAKFIVRKASETKELNQVLRGINPDSENLVILLQGMHEALEQGMKVEMPIEWNTFLSKLPDNEEVQSLSLAIGQLLGDSGASQTLMKSLADNRTSSADKREAIASLAKKRWQALVPYLQENLQNEELSADVLMAAAKYQDLDLATSIVSNYHDLPTANRGLALQALASAPSGGVMLLEAMQSGWIDRSDVPQYTARQLRRVLGSGFMEYWGPLDDPPARKKELYQKYTAMLDPSELIVANPANGEGIFRKSCGNCHTMYGEGGNIGPDLTGSNRTDVQYLLSNLVEPSADIQDAYKMMVVTTQNGRTVVGNLAHESDQQVTMRVVGAKDEAINKSSIQSLEVLDISLMPEGLLETLSEQEVKDLFSYLQRLEE